jgi:Ca2+-binding EF-hand superfamily protein
MQHRDRFFPFFLIALALAAPAGASAQDKAAKAQDKPKPAPKNPYVERFKELDRNRDGYVSLTEWPLEPASFHVVDRDQDGRLSRNELLTPNVLREAPPEVQFRRLDTDRDGRLSRSERQRDGFDRLDRNKDGYITLPQYRQETWSPHATVQDEIRFRNLDRNHDNRLNRTEWTGSSLLFNHLDRDRDGALSPSEWPK